MSAIIQAWWHHATTVRRVEHSPWRLVAELAALARHRARARYALGGRELHSLHPQARALRALGGALRAKSSVWDRESVVIHSRDSCA